MNEINKTLYIPLYGKAQISRRGILLRDPMAEGIWSREAFPIRGKAKSKWLCYNMAMRARVFDDWTRALLERRPDAAVIQIGCGLDSRCLRVGGRAVWIDCDLPEVIRVRKTYYEESGSYSMRALDAGDREALQTLPGGPCAIVVLEGLCMYLTNEQVSQMLRILGEKYREVHVLMDVYTQFGARASKFKNPVNTVGVSNLYGVDSIAELTAGTGLRCITEHSFTPEYLVEELRGFDRWFFRLMFTGKLYRKIYRLYELSSEK